MRTYLVEAAVGYDTPWILLFIAASVDETAELCTCGSKIRSREGYAAVGRSRKAVPPNKPL